MKKGDALFPFFCKLICKLQSIDNQIKGKGFSSGFFFLQMEIIERKEKKRKEKKRKEKIGRKEKYRKYRKKNRKRS